jgi:hypothetical protein
MTFELKMARLRSTAPTLVSLLTAMHDRPDVAQLDDWVYCCADYNRLGALLSEMHPTYEGLTFLCMTDGHNAFEEFVITVWDGIARSIEAFPEEGKYDIDLMTDLFYRDILCEQPDEITDLLYSDIACYKTEETDSE